MIEVECHTVDGRRLHASLKYRSRSHALRNGCTHNIQTDVRIETHTHRPRDATGVLRLFCNTRGVDLADSVTHVLVVGDVAKTLGMSPEEIDTIAGADARVIRTVLRSEVLRILASGPLDVVITALDASFLGSDEFLAAFAARVLPVSLLMLTRTLDEPNRQRLRSAGVHVEHIAPPIGLEALRERVALALRHSRLASTAVREPLTQLVRRIHGERG